MLDRMIQIIGFDRFWGISVFRVFQFLGRMSFWGISEFWLF